MRDVCLPLCPFALVFWLALSALLDKQFRDRPGIKEFLIELIFAHIEHKHPPVLLSREFKVLDKRKKMGQLKPQYCRVKTKIREMSVEPPASSSGAGGKPKSGAFSPEYAVPAILCARVNLGL